MLLVQLILPQGSNYCLRVCYNTVNTNNLKPLCTASPSASHKPAQDFSLLEGAVFPQSWGARDSSATHNPTCSVLLLHCRATTMVLSPQEAEARSGWWPDRHQFSLCKNSSKASSWKEMACHWAKALSCQ